MNKILSKSLFIIFSSIYLISCKKDGTSNAGNVSLDGFVKTRIRANNSISLKDEYFYDSQGRIDSVNSENGAGRMIYKYPSASKVTVDIIKNANNTLQIHAEYYLNSSNLQDSSFQYNNTNDSSSEKYMYNAQGKLSAYKKYRVQNGITAYLLNEKNYVYNSSGNISQELSSNSISVINYTYTNYQYSLKVGVLPIVQTPSLFPLQKVTSNNGTPSETIDYSYTFDNKNRVLTETQLRNNSPYLTTSYTYY